MLASIGPDSMYASLPHPARMALLCAASARRFAKKLQHSLGESCVMFHVEPSLPHSWAILPNPSMATLQEVVVRFIAAEHAATVAAVGQPAAAQLAAESAGLVCCG
jgi:hypothetical protein